MTETENKAEHVWICTFCGQPYDNERAAQQCWDAHEELTVDFVWGGIGSGTDLPVEVLLKRHQRGFVTEIATYSLKDIKKGLKLRVRKIAKKS